MNFADYIDLAVERQDCSQNEIGRRIGITGSALSQIKKGSPASETTLVKLARLAGVSLDELMLAYNEEHASTIEVKNMWARMRTVAASAVVAFPLASANDFLTTVQCILC